MNAAGLGSLRLGALAAVMALAVNHAAALERPAGESLALARQPAAAGLDRTGSPGAEAAPGRDEAASRVGQRAQDGKPSGTVTVKSLEFTGVTQVDEAQLRAVLATRASSWLPWGRKQRFDRAAFEADLRRIEAFYADRGFPDARVTSVDVNSNEAGDSVSLVVHVAEGEPVRVAELRYEGFEELPEGDLRSLEDRVALREGEPFDRAALATAREAAANALRDHGFPYPSVAARQEPAGNGRDVVITLVAQPGTKMYFGETDVQGAKDVGDGVVRRALMFKPGDLYRLSVVRESQRKLYGLELFQFVNVVPVREGIVEQGETAVVPMQVTVTEANHRRLRFSFGYGTEEKARAEGEYRQLNFLGGGRSGGVHGKWSSLERGVRADFREPYFFAPRWSAVVDAQRWYSEEPMYRAVSSGGNLTIAYQPGPLNTFSLTGTTIFQSSRIANWALSDLSVRDYLISLGLDPRTGVQDGLLNALSLDAQRSTVDNPLDATRGYSATFHLERALGVLRGSYRYWNLSLDLRHYVSAGPIVVAGRARTGQISPDGGDGANVPFAKRYFLGGSTSIRGWGRYEVSPLSGSGLPLGGFSMLEASLELRARIFGQLQGVAFVDAGNVWTDQWDVSVNDLRYAVGPGLRYTTPIGPLRFDLGYQLNPIPNLLIEGKPEARRWRIHFSIGQAF